jgi:phosphomevalonate kinase
LCSEENISPLQELLPYLVTSNPEKYYNLFFIDFGISSDTRKMVSSVKTHFTQNPASKTKFLKISESMSQNILDVLKKLDEKKGVEINTRVTGGEYASIGVLMDRRKKAAVLYDSEMRWLKMMVGQHRKNLKGLGESAGCEIEPDFFSRLFEVLDGEKGVVMCLCPGAGGWDAVVVWTELELGKEELGELVRGAVEKISGDEDKGLGEFSVMQVQVL